MLPELPITHCEEIKDWLWKNHLITHEFINNYKSQEHLTYTFYHSGTVLTVMLLTDLDRIIVEIPNNSNYTADKITLNNLFLILEAFGYKNADCSLLKKVYEGRKEEEMKRLQDERQ